MYIYSKILVLQLIQYSFKLHIVLLYSRVGRESQRQVKNFVLRFRDTAHGVAQLNTTACPTRRKIKITLN